MSELPISGRAVFEAINGKAPGQFLQTEHGSIHFLMQGPATGKLVILQHGLGSYLATFDKIANDLVAKGYRLLRYDLYDRGYSETDPKRYPVKSSTHHPLDFTLEVYVQQLRDVLTKLDLLQNDFIHVGHSIGGVVGIGYSSLYPDRVKGLCLIDSVCLPVRKPLVARIANLPVLGDIVVKYFGANTMIKFSTESCHNPDFPGTKELLDNVARNIRENDRYFAAIRSTNQNCKGFVGSAEDEFRKCCQAKIPMHLIWGRADASVPYSLCLKLKEISKSEGIEVEETSFEGMPHNVYFADAKAEECSQTIQEFCSTSYSS